MLVKADYRRVPSSQKVLLDSTGPERPQVSGLEERSLVGG